MIKYIDVQNEENQTLYRGLFSLANQTKTGKTYDGKLVLEAAAFLYLMSEVANIAPAAIDMYNAVGSSFCSKFNHVFIVM